MGIIRKITNFRSNYNYWLWTNDNQYLGNYPSIYLNYYVCEACCLVICCVYTPPVNSIAFKSDGLFLLRDIIIMCCVWMCVWIHTLTLTLTRTRTHLHTGTHAHAHTLTHQNVPTFVIVWIYPPINRDGMVYIIDMNQNVCYLIHSDPGQVNKKHHQNVNPTHTHRNSAQTLSRSATKLPEPVLSIYGCLVFQNPSCLNWHLPHCLCACVCVCVCRVRVFVCVGACVHVHSVCVISQLVLLR